MKNEPEYFPQRSQLEDANFALHYAYEEIDELNKSICTLVDLVEQAYFCGWRSGASTGISDSPEWNVCEDWLDEPIRDELKKYQRVGKPEEEE